VPELVSFVRNDLIPGLEAGPTTIRPTPPPDPAVGNIRRPSKGEGLIDLRNLLAHGGAMTRSEARFYLSDGDWGTWLEHIVERLAFLSQTDLCYLSGGKAQRLVGPDAGLGEERPLSGGLRLALRELDHHVVVIRLVQPLHEERWVDLWPLCDYGRARSDSLRRSREAERDSPFVYICAEQDRLLYAALGVELPLGVSGSDVLAQFRTLFRLREGEPSRSPGAQSVDFEDELRRDAAALVGREAEIEHALEVLRATQTGVLWLEGQGGIGKSFLLAKLAMDASLTGNPRKLLRIAWRFRAGDQNRCRRDAFFRHAVARLADWLGKTGFEPKQEVEALFEQLQGLLDEVAARKPSSDHPQARAPRVVFLLDGVDEIGRNDPGFARDLFELRRDNVIWLCAGRPEGLLPQVFAPSEVCTHMFAGGLPPMSDDDVRGMLIDGSGSLKYDLVRLDEEHQGDDGIVDLTNALARHPTALFQSLWNNRWWYDCPAVAAFYRPPASGRSPEGTPWLRPAPDRLSTLLEVGVHDPILRLRLSFIRTVS